MSLRRQYEVAIRRNARIPDNLSLAPRATSPTADSDLLTHPVLDDVMTDA